MNLHRNNACTEIGVKGRGTRHCVGGMIIIFQQLASLTANETILKRNTLRHRTITSGRRVEHCPRG